jgi:hypothetical protein
MNKQNMLILEKYPKLWDTLIVMLQNMKEVNQPLATSTIQHL